MSDDAERGPLQVMYGIDGRQKLDESTLDHLQGYEHSRPVRIGNAAYQQLQLDIYGEMLDSVYLANKYGEAISYAGWQDVQRILAWLEKNWHPGMVGDRQCVSPRSRNPWIGSRRTQENSLRQSGPTTHTVLTEITLHNLRVGANTATLRFWKENSETRYEVLSSEGELYVSQEVRREVDIDSIRTFGS